MMTNLPSTGTLWLGVMVTVIMDLLDTVVGDKLMLQP